MLKNILTDRKFKVKQETIDKNNNTCVKALKNLNF